MSRRANIKGLRLGVSTWWQSRTPPLSRGQNQEIYDTIIKGFFKKFRYIIAEYFLFRSIKSKGSIVILGANLKRRSNLQTKIYKNRLTVYIIQYIKHLLNTYLNLDYNFSYRQQKSISQNSSSLLAYVISNNHYPLITSLKRVNKWVRRH